MSLKSRVENLESQFGGVGPSQVGGAEQESGDRSDHPVFYQPDPNEDKFFVVIRGKNARIVLPHSGREPIPPQSKIIVGVHPINDVSLATRQQRE